MDKRKVLLISETLGTANPDDPWRAYSTAVLEELVGAGAAVTLLVERAFGFDGGTNARGAADEEASLTGVYRYLATARHAPKLFYRGRFGRLLALHMPRFLRAFTRRVDRRSFGRETPVRNQVRSAAGLPERLAYLDLVDSFLFLRRFYSAASLKAVYGTGPVEVDASHFDVVVVDGLVPVHVLHDGGGKVVFVVRNMATLSAPNSRLKQRLIAAQALACIAARQDGTCLFATTFDQTRFTQLVSDDAARAGKLLGRLCSQSHLASVIKPPPLSSTYLTAFDKQARKAEFLRSVQIGAILDRIAHDALSTTRDAESADEAGRPGERPIAILMWRVETVNDRHAVASFADSLSDILRLIVFGVSAHSRSLNKDSNEAELPSNLMLLGDISTAERHQLMSSALFVVYPRLAESGPELLEPVALAIPVICYDLGANREFTEGAAVTLVPPTMSMLAAVRKAAVARAGLERSHHGSTVRPADRSGTRRIFSEILA